VADFSSEADYEDFESVEHDEIICSDSSCEENNIAEDFIGVDGIDRQMSDLTVDTDETQGSCSGSGSSSSSSSSSSIRSNGASFSGTHRALMPSLFSHVPPTINFVLDGQTCNCLFVWYFMSDNDYH